MTTLSTIVSTVYVIGMALCALMWIRNYWVYKQRMKALDDGLERYDRLPSYDAMLWRIWIWDVTKFEKKN